MGNRWSQELGVAVEAVRRASIACRNVAASITMESRAKKDRSPVTVADYASQAIICRAIAAAYPDDRIVAEEDSAELRLAENAGVLGRVAEEVARVDPTIDAGAVCDWIDRGGAPGSGSRFWTLDPIDGTKGFLRGEQYAIALALVEEGEAVAAVLGCPNLVMGRGRPGVMVTAVRGLGALRVSLDDASAPEAIEVSSVAVPAEARFCESVEAGHSAHDESARIAVELGFAGAPRRLDSQAKYAVVAAGEAEVYLRLPTRADYREKIWDHAAGSLVVECAGGRVTDVDGRPLDFSLGRELAGNRGIVASNGRLHDRVVEAIGRGGGTMGVRRHG